MNDVRSAHGGGRGERAAAAVNSQRRAGPSGAGIPRPTRTEPPEPRRCCSAAGSGLGAAAVGGDPEDSFPRGTAAREGETRSKLSSGFGLGVAAAAGSVR